MSLSYKNTVRNYAEVGFFANKGEAAVFWLSVAGLLFLAMILVFRYFTDSRKFGESTHDPALQKVVERIQSENDGFRREIQELSTQVNELNKLIRNRDSGVNDPESTDTATESSKIAPTQGQPDPLRPTKTVVDIFKIKSEPQ